MNVGGDVGFRVGLIRVPDIAGVCGITNLSSACRKCRGYGGGGTAVARRTNDLSVLTCLARWGSKLSTYSYYWT